jgi:TPR repeat protein
MLRPSKGQCALLVFALCASRAGAMTQAEQLQASTLNQKHDWQALAALAGRAVQRDSKDAWAWYYSGVANDGLGHKGMAATAFEKALSGLPAYLQGSAAQLLAQEYAALNQQAKLAALIAQFEKSSPEIARTLRLQFPGSTPRPAAPVLPEVSPRTLAEMTANARRSWKPDAIPVQISVEYQDNLPYQAIYSFYSPSARVGLRQMQNGPQFPADDPRGWSSVAIPSNFVPLAEAVRRVTDPGQNPLVQHAYLMVEESGIPAVALAWSITFKTANLSATELPAYVMPKTELDQLNAAAQRGDAASQYLVAMVDLSGVAGLTDAAKSAAWLAKAAAQGHVEAENKLAQFYEYGAGVPSNPSVAAQWYLKAANTGFAPAQYNLGLMFEEGRGVARNYVTARQWIEKAARQGSMAAMAEMPIVTARANGDIRRAEQLRTQQSTGNNSGTCRPGFFGGHGSPCRSFSLMIWAQQHPR